MKVIKIKVMEKIQESLITFTAVLRVRVALVVVVHRGTSRHICNKKHKICFKS